MKKLCEDLSDAIALIYVLLDDVESSYVKTNLKKVIKTLQTALKKGKKMDKRLQQYRKAIEDLGFVKKDI